jgi:putative ABC transport system permease protein
MISPEHVTNVPIRRKADSVLTNVVLRGVGAKGTVLRSNFHLVSGRMFKPGMHELIAGLGAASHFDGLTVGDKVRLPTSVWTVVGSFTTGGDLIEGQLLGDIDTVLPGVNRNGYGSVVVRLESLDAFNRFRAALTTNPALDVDVERQSDFYARTFGQLATFLATLAYTLGGIMAIGALFGTVNIMYSAVSARMCEIATLRALGFGAAPVAVSVVGEALLLAILGSMIGAFFAWILFNGTQVSAHLTASESVFHLAVTPGLVAVGLSWAVIIAFLGALFPAIRAARLPVATALRRA